MGGKETNNSEQVRDIFTEVHEEDIDDEELEEYQNTRMNEMVGGPSLPEMERKGLKKFDDKGGVVEVLLITPGEDDMSSELTTNEAVDVIKETRVKTTIQNAEYKLFKERTRNSIQKAAF